MAFFLAALPSVSTAQSFNIAVVAGALQYDAGGDDSYFTYGIQARYFVSPAFRVGLIGNTSHIGDPPREWAAPGSDEQIWRLAAMAEFAARPFDKGAVSIRGLLGVFHSSGIIYQGPPPGLEAFWGITDTPTGVSYGGGLGFEVGPFSRMRFLLEGNIWMDNAYGSAGFDPELVLGVGVDL